MISSKDKHREQMNKLKIQKKNSNTYKVFHYYKKRIQYTKSTVAIFLSSFRNKCSFCVTVVLETFAGFRQEINQEQVLLLIMEISFFSFTLHKPTFSQG